MPSPLSPSLNLSRTQLLGIAKNLHVFGRSKMGKEELVREIRFARRTNAARAAKNAARRNNATARNKLRSNAGIDAMYRKFGIAPPR